MQKAKDIPGSFTARARSNVREIVLALVLTVGAAVFMMATLSPAVDQSTKSADQRRP